MKKLLIITMLLCALYSDECENANAHGDGDTNFNCDCNENTWQEYYDSEGHNMQGCWLYEANLEGANLNWANLEGAYISVANLEGATLYIANLSGAILGWSNFSGANLGWANLTGAQVSEANLTGANLGWANLTGAFTWNTNLEGACLEGAMNFTQTTYIGTPILEGCAFGGGNCSFEDVNEDGYDDASFDAGHNVGASSTDNNNDGLVDSFPIISIIDGNATMLMQNSLDTYIDSGASCLDQEEGDISHQVEVSGDIVNMSNPGTYIISYNCSDSDGNTAQTQNRTVFVIPPTIADINEDGFDDDAFMAGAQSGDANLDGILNVIDIVIYISSILNGE